MNEKLNHFGLGVVLATAILLLVHDATRAQSVPEFRDLFNGTDLTGWVNVNTKRETWSVRDGMLICHGHPIGVMRSEKQYENFVLHIEWRHMEAGGNSGVFIWSAGSPAPGEELPKGLEVQMLELQWPFLNPDESGKPRPIAYVHGELFGANGLETTPDNPRGERSMSRENRCKGKGEWNTYDVVAVDGVVKLSVNGKFVNGVRNASVRKGYLCLESEGAEIHFRNIKIMELPSGLATPEQTAPVVGAKSW
jgi:3-keto-disaccharide hydrolase